MDKNLLIIGGSSDIGMAVAEDQACSYDRIIIHYHHMNDRLSDIMKRYKNVNCIQANLASENSTVELINQINEQGIVPTHILHLPASKYEARKFHKTKWAVIEEELHISLRSAAMILGSFLPKMSRNGYGKIVIMLSMVINGMPPKHNADYVIVKEALYGLVKAIAVEYAEKGISINGISPALIETKFIENIHDYTIGENAKLSPVGRNLIIADIIPTIRFLMSEGSDCINGQNISVTCGR